MGEQEINGINKGGNISTITYQSKLSETTYSDLCVSKLGRTTQVSNNDFLEYGTKFLIEKSKYNDIILQNLFNEYTQEIIGKDIADIETKSSAIFPTMVSETSGDNPLDDYFGITVTDKIKLIVLNVKVRNTDDRLVLKDPDDNELKYIDLKSAYVGDNINTILYIIISNTGEIKVNLAKKAWIDDLKNPLRNLKEYYLRKDELKKLISYINPVSNIGNNRMIDTTSGTFIGNEKIELSDLPIYNRKINKSSVSSVIEIDNWSSSNIYNYGDEAKVSDTVWTSLTNRNRGNHPQLSQAWEMSRNLSNYYTDRLIIDFNNFHNLDLNPGDIYPDKNISFFRDDKDVKIIVNTNPGILLKSDHIIAIDDSGTSTELTKDIDYLHTISQNYENLVVFDNSFFDELRNYEKLLFNITRSKLSLNVLFYTIIGNIENQLSGSIIKDIISVSYTDAITPENKTIVNLSNEKDAVGYDGNIKQDEETKEDQSDYKLYLVFDEVFEGEVEEKIGEKTIKYIDYAAKTTNIITYNNNPNIYICDELTIKELSNTGIQQDEKIYFPEYIIDNKGNIVNLTKDENSEYKSAKIIVSPESRNEINPIITYKVYFTLRKFNINIVVEDDNILDYIIFDKYEYTTDETNSVNVRYYKTTTKDINFYVDDSEVALENSGIIKDVCNYERNFNSNIKTIKFSEIKKSFKLKCKVNNNENK